jgi:hypothetical protein
VPRWHHPDARFDHVGELGAVENKAAQIRGAINIRNAIKFVGPSSWHSIAGRHIFADHHGQVEAEIAFLNKRPLDLPELLDRIGQTQVNVKKASLGPGSLAEAGLLLAERYFLNSHLTSESTIGRDIRETILVHEGAGSPFLVLTGKAGDVEPPSSALPFEGHSRSGKVAWCWPTSVGGLDLDVWWLEMSPHPRGTRMAVVRGLCSIVGWLQELGILARIASSPKGIEPYKLEAARCERFLRDRAGKLRHLQYEGWPVAPILARVTQQSAASQASQQEFVKTVAPLLPKEVGNDILAILRGIGVHQEAVRLQITRNTIVAGSNNVNMGQFQGDVCNLIDRANAVPHKTRGELRELVAGLKNFVEVINKGEIDMSEDKPKGDERSINATVTNSQNTNIGSFYGAVTNVFRSSPSNSNEMKDKILALSQELDKLKDRLAPDQVQPLQHDVESLAREASTTKRPSTLRFLADNIIAPLKDLADVASPAIALVKGVLLLVGVTV